MLNIREIAQADPALALVLAQSGRVNKSDGAVGILSGNGVGEGGDCGLTQVGLAGWELINLKGRWDSGAADQLKTGQITGIVETDLWIREVRYTVRRPNYALGAWYKGQSDYYNSLNPNIEFQLTVNSYARYIISQTWTPLENIRETFQCVCPAGLVLSCSANIQALFRNVRAFVEDEIPTEAIITFSGVRLPLGSYGACQAQNAAALLKEMGYLL